MRVLLWAPHGAGEHYWGPGISAYNLYCTSNKSINFSISIAHGFKEQKKFELFQEQYYLGNIKHLGIIGSLLFLIRAKFWINKNFNKFDVVHVLGSHHISFLPAIWFQKKGIKTYVKIANVNSGFSNNSIISKVLRLSNYRKKNAQKISGYISISTAITNELISIGIRKEKIFFIPNGVDVFKFHPLSKNEKSVLRRELQLNDLFTIIIVGEICKRKNQKLVLDAFLSLSERKDMQLLIIGPPGKVDDQSDEIHKIIKDNNLNNVRIIGFTKDIVKYYQASDVFILPSINEGLSNSMLEAMSTGLPAIVTKISGSEDVITNYKNGIFIKLSINDIKTAIDYYYNNSDKLIQNSNNAMKLIFSNYNSRNVLQKHIETFNKSSL